MGGRNARNRSCERLLAALEDCQRKHRHMADVSRCHVAFIELHCLVTVLYLDVHQDTSEHMGNTPKSRRRVPFSCRWCVSSWSPQRRGACWRRSAQPKVRTMLNGKLLCPCSKADIRCHELVCLRMPEIWHRKLILMCRHAVEDMNNCVGQRGGSGAGMPPGSVPKRCAAAARRLEDCLEEQQRLQEVKDAARN